MIRNLPFSLIKIFFMATLLLPIIAPAQVGLGGHGAFNYPGVSESEKSNIRLDGGLGYGLFLRHDVWSAPGYAFHLRYNTSFSDHKATVPGFGDSDYELSSFGLDVLLEWRRQSLWRLYAGIGINLLSVTGKARFQNNYVGETLHPSLSFGARYSWFEGFDAFGELVINIASTDAGPENIPLYGPALRLGITMFLSEEE